jgi:hypothetical protein
MAFENGTKKCNYSIFTKNNHKENLNINFFNVSLNKSENTLFLGIRFDNNLNFENQIDYLSESCSKRLNCIKILSNPKYKVTAKNLTVIYTTLIRSIMDTLSMILSRLTAKRYNKLKVIQNTALRLIIKQKYDTPTASLHQISTYKRLKKEFTI